MEPSTIVLMIGLLVWVVVVQRTYDGLLGRMRLGELHAARSAALRWGLLMGTGMAGVLAVMLGLEWVSGVTPSTDLLFEIPLTTAISICAGLALGLGTYIRFRMDSDHSGYGK